jgi:hypothetical protein
MPPPPGSNMSRRAMPADFPEMYVLLGYVETEWHYRASQHTVRRWVRDFGLERQKMGGNGRAASPPQSGRTASGRIKRLGEGGTAIGEA